MQRLDWVGVYYMDAGCAYLASVAYRRPDGSIAPRETSRICTLSNIKHGLSGGINPEYETQHYPCPLEPSGGDFHFYGDELFAHWHNCTLYAPRPEVTQTPDGYAINPITTQAKASLPNWPNGIPAYLANCDIDPELIRKLSDAMFKKAAAKPGYAGAPYAPIAPGDSRPGTAKVNDLLDNPGSNDSSATPAPAPVPNTAAPPPTPISPTPGTPGAVTVNATVDLGPNPSVPSPEVGEAPTGIMDPIFAWLPDLPSITLDTNNTECPVWAINLTDFGGPGWSYLLESHCDLMESQRAIISSLMLALFGIGAAMIILRA
jgi:hypothetical protein